MVKRYTSWDVVTDVGENIFVLEADYAALSEENRRLREAIEAMADRLDAYKYFYGLLTEEQLTEWDLQRIDWMGGKGQATHYRDTLKKIAEYQNDCTKQDCSDCEHYNACELALMARRALEG